VEGISSLKNLEGLNPANNQIEFIKGNEFPFNIQLLYLKDNPGALVQIGFEIECQLQRGISEESEITRYARWCIANHSGEIQAAGNVTSYFHVDF